MAGGQALYLYLSLERTVSAQTFYRGYTSASSDRRVYAGVKGRICKAAVGSGG